jgi:integrase
MKGHIRERSPGHWAIVIDVRDPQTGKRKRRWHSFAGTKRQAQVECARLLTETKNGTSVDPTRMTVATFLERWIEHMEGQVSPRSHERYAEIARKNIAPLLGGLGLTKLQPAHISQAYTKALTSGRRDGSGGLSPRTVTHMHRVLREALQQAVRWQLLARNPADAVKPPKVERRQMSVLDADATAGLIEAARATTLFVPILLGVRCGMRRGEVVALRWRNVDLERGQISVVASAEQTDQGVREKEPKNGKGRTVVLSATEVEELRSHRVQQAQTLLALGVRLTDDHHVVARLTGRRCSPDRSPMHSSSSPARTAFKSGCTTCAIRTQRTCWHRACIRRSRRNGLGIRAWGSPSISTRMFSPECRLRQSIALTQCCVTR